MSASSAEIAGRASGDLLIRVLAGVSTGSKFRRRESEV
jgi:hypothetical protein